MQGTMFLLFAMHNFDFKYVHTNIFSPRKSTTTTSNWHSSTSHSTATSSQHNQHPFQHMWVHNSQTHLQSPPANIQPVQPSTSTSIRGSTTTKLQDNWCQPTFPAQPTPMPAYVGRQSTNSIEGSISQRPASTSSRIVDTHGSTTIHWLRPRDAYML